jgi:hypothetical protein
VAEHTSVIDLHGRRNHPAYDPVLNPRVVYIVGAVLEQARGGTA